ncbi:hypothetical protein TNCV_3242021 [Trichonephila clavipes]|nr:hypothetical protein TNCV_3242021 [Trichonephila clavipes]
MRVRYRSRQDDRLRVMLVLVHIDITPPHTPLPVFWRIGEERYHIRGEHMAPRQRREKDAIQITSGSPMSEGRFVLGTFRSGRNANTLPITPRRLSSRVVGTSSYRYHTTTNMSRLKDSTVGVEWKSDEESPNSDVVLVI